MKKLRERFSNLLRDPATQTIIAVASLIATVTWGAIQGWLAKFLTWLVGSSFWPNWSITLPIFLLLILGGKWIKTKSRESSQKVKPNGMTYHEVWGVLWEWNSKGQYLGDGPLCTKHKLPVDLEEELVNGKRTFIFSCPGYEGEKRHKVKGPNFSRLVGSKGDDWREVNIYQDVIARLKAEKIKQM